MSATSDPATPAPASAPTATEGPAPAPAPAPAEPGSDRAARRRRAARGTTRVDRVDRSVLTVLALAATAVGTWALVGSGRSPNRLYADAASSVADRPDVALGATLAVCAVVLALSLRWAWSQVSPRSGDGRIATTTVARTPHGVTTVEPAPAARALARDLETVAGVHAARVRIISLGSSPELIASIDLDRGTELAAARAAVEAPLARFAASTNARTLDAELRLRATAHRPPKVQ